ncbi:MAG: hypothetical protein C0506_00975 [Anaerolinea sp.]|nr:hypothetical protein [Anaerolinea sp.]
MKTRSGERTGKWTRYVLALAAMVAAAGLVVAGGATEAKAATGTIGFATGSSTVVEGQNATIVLNRTGGTSGTINVDYTISFTPPATSADLNGLTGPSQVTFTDGVSSRTLPGLANGPLSTFDDGANQGSRNITFTLTAADNGGFLGGTTTHVLTITDNDGPPKYTFTANTMSVNESAGTINVPIVRDGATAANNDTVQCTDAGTGTATPGGGNDYTFALQNIVFTTGTTTQNCQVTILQDVATEPSQTIVLNIAATVGFGGGPGTYTQITITIVDDDGTGTIQFSAATYTVSEGVGTANIAVTRTNGTTGAASIQCSTTGGGSATASPAAGFDYTTQTNQPLNWGNGVGGTQNCSIPITGDSTVEGTETITLALTGVTGATAGAQSTATVNITDDDGTGTISFTATNYTVAENGTSVTISANRTGGSSGAATVDFATSNGTATLAGSDYLANSGTLSWNNGETGNRTFAVTILDDSLVEGAETINLTLSNVTGGAVLASPSTATITISDNESALPTISSLSPTAGPLAGGNTVTITGTNFLNATSVTFGGSLATNLNVFTANTITVTAPVSPGLITQTVNVVVTTTSGSSSTVGTADDYTYTTGPTVTLVSPNTGPSTGTTFVSITGTNFTSSGMTVTFGGTQATFAYVSSTSLTAVSPAHTAGTFDIIVTTPAGSSPNTVLDDFTYTGTIAPAITSISPTSGPVGTVVTVTGSGFTGSSVVTVGGVSASFTVSTDSSLTVTVPASTPGGTVDIRVTNSGGTSPNTAADNFNNTSSSGATTTYVLYFRWTLIAWTGIDNLTVYNAVRGIETGTANPNTNDVSGQVTALWYWDAASQTYKGYFVGFENVPGANDFTTMRRGISYWVAVTSTTTNWTVLVGQ